MSCTQCRKSHCGDKMAGFNKHLSLAAMAASSVNMMTSSNGNIFRIAVHFCKESTCDLWIPTHSFYVFFDLRLHIQLCKQSWGRWFVTPSRSLWRHCIEGTMVLSMYLLLCHYSVIIMSAMVSQITSFSINYSRSTKISKSRVPGLSEGNSPVTSNAENVAIWWRQRKDIKVPRHWPLWWVTTWR